MENIQPSEQETITATTSVTTPSTRINTPAVQTVSSSSSVRGSVLPSTGFQPGHSPLLTQREQRILFPPTDYPQLTADERLQQWTDQQNYFDDFSLIPPSRNADIAAFSARSAKSNRVVERAPPKHRRRPTSRPSHTVGAASESSSAQGNSGSGARGPAQLGRSANDSFIDPDGDSHRPYPARPVVRRSIAAQTDSPPFTAPNDAHK